MLTRQTLGLPGLLGAILIIAWAFGFIVLGMHGPIYHLMVPAAALLILIQGVRRVNTED